MRMASRGCPRGGNASIESGVAATALEVILLTAAVLGTAWGSVLVHESGHYCLGRLLGVPASSMSIRLERPPHVALDHEGRWLPPDHPDYPTAFAQHNPSARAAWTFVAGGVVVETVVVLALAAVFRGQGALSLVLVGTSTALVMAYLLADLTLSIRRAHPYGDFAAMWTITTVPTVTVIVVILLVRAGALLALAGS
jgi:hypothetical protein